MPTVDYDRALTVRTADKPRRAIERVVYKLKLVDDLAFGNRGTATKEAIINASWLWLDDLPEELLAQVMRRYLPRLEAILRGEPDPGGFPGGMPPLPRESPANYDPFGPAANAADDESGPARVVQDIDRTAELEARLRAPRPKKAPPKGGKKKGGSA